MNRRRTAERVVYGIGGAGALLSLAIATAEGFLRGGYDLIAEPISALALGPRGWIQQLNFALFAVSLFAFAAVLRAQFRQGAASIAGPCVFVLMATGILMAGAFTMDAPGESPTIVGRLHTVAGYLVFPWIPVILFIVARRFRRDDRWRSYRAYTLASGIFCLAAMVFFLLFVGTPDQPPRLASEIRGLVQRLILLPFSIWIALVARRAYRGHKEASAPARAGDAERALSM